MINKILLYDNNCEICSSSVGILFRYLKKNDINIVGLNSSEGRELEQKYFLAQYDSVIFISDDKVFTYSDAIIEVVSECSFPINLLAVLKIIPGPIRNLVYRKFAKYRHRIFRNNRNRKSDL